MKDIVKRKLQEVESPEKKEVLEEVLQEEARKSMDQDTVNTVEGILVQEEEPVTLGQLTKATGLPRDKVQAVLRVLIEDDRAEVTETQGNVDLFEASR